MSRLPYVQPKGGSFYIRLVVPKPLRPFVENGKGEVLRSLGNSQREVKANHARALASAQDELDVARRRKADAESVEHSREVRRYARLEPDQIARTLYREELRLDMIERTFPDRDAVPDMTWSRPTRVANLRRAAAGAMANDELDSTIGWALEEFRQRGNHDLAFGTVEWRELAMKLARVQLEFDARTQERNDGDFDGVPKMPALAVDEPDVGPVVTFDEIIDAKAIKEAGGADGVGVPSATLRQFRNACASFAKARGNDNATTVTFDEGEAWIDSLRAEGRLKAKTMAGMLQAVRTVLGWGREVRRNAFLAVNPLTGVKLPKGQVVPPSERTYTLDEAKAVLRAAQAETNPTLRFVPWITAYSGTRVSEVAGLRPDDFFQLGGAWFFKIEPRAGRRVKTTSSIRRVPVHPDLVEHGLIEHVNGTPAGTALFGTRVQPRLSEWMHRKVKVTRENLAPNHGFRHLFEDLCTEAGMRDDARAYITGRGTRSSRDKYGRSDAGLPGLAREMRSVPTILTFDPTVEPMI